MLTACRSGVGRAPARGGPRPRRPRARRRAPARLRSRGAVRGRRAQRARPRRRRRREPRRSATPSAGGSPRPARSAATRRGRRRPPARGRRRAAPRRRPGRGSPRRSSARPSGNGPRCCCATPTTCRPTAVGTALGLDARRRDGGRRRGPAGVPAALDDDRSRVRPTTPPTSRALARLAEGGQLAARDATDPPARHGLRAAAARSSTAQERRPPAARPGSSSSPCPTRRARRLLEPGRARGPRRLLPPRPASVLLVRAASRAGADGAAALSPCWPCARRWSLAVGARRRARRCCSARAPRGHRPAPSAARRRTGWSPPRRCRRWPVARRRQVRTPRPAARRHPRLHARAPPRAAVAHAAAVAEPDAVPVATPRPRRRPWRWPRPRDRPRRHEVTVSGTGWTPGHEVDARLPRPGRRSRPAPRRPRSPTTRGRFTATLAAHDPQNLPGAHDGQAADGRPRRRRLRASPAELTLGAPARQPRRRCSISATRKASSSDWPLLSRGSQAVS